MQRNKQQKSKSGENSQLLKTSLPRQLDTYGQVLSFKRAIGPVIQVDLTSTPVNIPAGSWASGVLAVSTDILNLTTQVASFSSRWAACFREYRVVGMRVSARIASVGTGSGELWMWLDEKSSPSPSASDAQSARRAIIPLAQAANGTRGSEAKLSWMPHDLLDLDFTQTNTAASDVYLKTYAAPGVTGTASATTASVIITASYRVQFRGVI